MTQSNNIREIVREEIEVYHKELNEKKEAERKVNSELMLNKAFKANFFAYTLASIVASLLFAFLLNDYGAKYYLYFGPAFIVYLIAFLIINKLKITPARKIDLSIIPIFISIIGLSLPFVFWV
ncbi:hypothetical protein O0Q50_20865 [Priestia aryabhattai]|uniref:Uncharacterized protein n=1 Tax=Priestia aryabhattai TaxID=412384 RepID=A0AAX6ND90_PRIAR|nr:hypothetical protein [Priestia aryabhattai]MDU9693630.1 hypothetical protein [Priestia aryabhattai]